MAINFPDSPYNGQTFTSNGKTWTYNGTSWTGVYSGSGNADTLDSYDSSYFLPSSSYTASDVLTKVKTVDGSGSGLDADLLDGQDGSYYLNYNNLTNKPTAVTVTPAAVSDQTNSSTGYFDVPAGTTAQRPASPSTGALRFNTTEEVMEFWDGYSWQYWGYVQTAATGGTITQDSTYKYHTFTSGQTTFSVTTASTTATVEVIMWGAGGAGANPQAVAGGGGACVVANLPVRSGDSFTVSIGTGGSTGSGACVAGSGGGAGGTGPLLGSGGRGGNAGTSGCSRGGAGGGAATIIVKNTTVMLCAGGGGGAGGAESGTPGAGGGGGQNGYNGQSSGTGGVASGNTNNTNGATIDPGGDQSAGGGGGGGYWGGGAGNPPGVDGQGGGGGGGGGNYVDSSITSYTIYAGSGQTPGNSSDSRNGGNYGWGGGTAASGKVGWCQIRYRITR